MFIDETECNGNDHVPKMEYAMKGDPPVQHRWLHRGELISAIAAMASTGMVSVELKKGSVNGDVFYVRFCSYHRCCHMMETIQNQLL